MFGGFEGFLLFGPWYELCLSDLLHDSQQIRSSELVIGGSDWNAATIFSVLAKRRLVFC